MGQRRPTASATSCQWVAFRFPRRRVYHLSRYASIRAMVSSCDQQGGGSRLGLGVTVAFPDGADVDPGGGAGRANGIISDGGGGDVFIAGWSCWWSEGEEGFDMV